MSSSDLSYLSGLHGIDFETIAHQQGTPCYVYDGAVIERQVQRWKQCFSSSRIHTHYAVKANANVHILRYFQNQGIGFDIVSAGELQLALRAGAHPRSIVFSGVGKTNHDIIEALKADIFCFNVESLSELKRIHHWALALHQKARVCLRINPDIEAQTHPHIQTGGAHHKFGMDQHDIETALQTPLSSIEYIGISCHLGSQIGDIGPFQKAWSVIEPFFSAYPNLTYCNLGGGFSVPYHLTDPVFEMERYAKWLHQILHHSRIHVILEPGRWLVAESGYLITRLLYLKPRLPHRFAIIDAGMCHLMRPALYQARHPIFQTRPAHPDQCLDWTLVGPICESSDCFGLYHMDLKEDDLLAIGCVGAYGFSMSHTYNGKPRVCELWIDSKHSQVIRPAESEPS